MCVMINLMILQLMQLANKCLKILKLLHSLKLVSNVIITKDFGLMMLCAWVTKKDWNIAFTKKKVFIINLNIRIF